MIFFVYSKDLIFFGLKFLNLLFIFGVNSEILSKKYSRIYFLINSSLIEFDIDLSFFSNIARDDGSFLL